MPPIIQVEHVSKQYRLGEVGTGTLSHDLKRWWYRARGKEDPYARIGEVNDRSTKGSSDYVWALQDINFSVAPGEVLGIIGRNGAGKSTLLKLLSKTTAPTTGKIKVRGRIASLLEVGTGFHPELTGRENIFLNGAILGMTRKEISHKFDEMVDFAGVERYIDTPVKRYSSGMYVRLAFAVAAHLEPEILIVDEVLAVGDAEFQKKCLGKMKDVSVNEGRTVLFVSHNMGAVKNLCSKGIYLDSGRVSLISDIYSVIDKYFKNDNISIENDRHKPEKKAYFISWHFENNKNSIISGDYCNLIFILKVQSYIHNAEFGFILRNNSNDIIFSCNHRDAGGDFINFGEGIYRLSFKFRFPVKAGDYEIDIAIVSGNEIIDQWLPARRVTVVSNFSSVLSEKWIGFLSEKISFSYDKKES